MNILVAGGAGFIGSHLSEKLIEQKHNVICVDNLLTGCLGNLDSIAKNENFLFINQDITQPIEVKTKIDAIFHLASPASPNHHSPLSYHALPMETMLANTSGTLELLKLAEKNQAKFLFASTSEVYGDPLEHPQKETYLGNVSSIGPRSVYDEAKRFGETLTAYFFRDRQVDTRIARIFNTYGPKMLKCDMRMIVAFATEALAEKPLTIFGDGQQTRSLCYVEDTVEGLIRLMFYPQTKGKIVNLGSPEEYSVLKYAQMVKKITQSSSKIIFSEKLPVDDPKKRKPDIDQAKKLLDWQPTVPLETGLRLTIDFLKNNP
jgi:nucleoside-diphosphate-sugar epimerase